MSIHPALRDALVVGIVYFAALVAYYGAFSVPLHLILAYTLWIVPICAAYVAGGAVLGGYNKSSRGGVLSVTLGGALALALVAGVRMVVRFPFGFLPLKVIVPAGLITLAALVYVRARDLRKPLFLGTAGVVAGVLIAELLLSVVYDPLDLTRVNRGSPYARYREMLVEAPVVGYMLRPNSHVVFVREEVDHYHMHVDINATGIRDHDYPPAKPAHTVRVLFAGDSVVFGAGIELRETMAKVLERSLNASATGSYMYEVMNWGVPGYSLRQELDFLTQANAARFQPDLLLVGVDPSLFGKTLNPNTYANMTGLGATGEVQRSLLSIPRNGIRSLRLYRLVAAVMHIVAPTVLVTPEDLDATAKDLRDFKAYADSLGIPIGFVLFPDEAQIDARAPRHAHESALYESLKAMVARLATPELDTLAVVRAATLRAHSRIYVKWDGQHFNAEGSVAVGRSIERFVQATWPQIIHVRGDATP